MPYALLVPAYITDIREELLEKVIHVLVHQHLCLSAARLHENVTDL